MKNLKGNERLHARTSTIRIPLTGPPEAMQLLGPRDTLLRAVQTRTSVKIVSRGGELLLRGSTEEVEQVAELFRFLLRLVQRGIRVRAHDALYMHCLLLQGRATELESLFVEPLDVAVRGQPVWARTLGQQAYVTAIAKHDVVFGLGPAGTGKTFLAVALAVSSLRARRVQRIVLTRPAVEAGERLGFLPGALQEKVDPYLRPLYDGLHSLLGTDVVSRMMDRGIIEIAPLAYMRGRTLEEAFIILDEAQNTTPEQMKMFLTRLGVGSKMVITGDSTQVDLLGGQRSGLSDAQAVLRGIQEICFVTLAAEDVVRHTLVQEVVRAYGAAGRRTALSCASVED